MPAMTVWMFSLGFAVTLWNSPTGKCLQNESSRFGTDAGTRMKKNMKIYYQRVCYCWRRWCLWHQRHMLMRVCGALPCDTLNFIVFSKWKVKMYATIRKKLQNVTQVNGIEPIWNLFSFIPVESWEFGACECMARAYERWEWVVGRRTTKWYKIKRNKMKWQKREHNNFTILCRTNSGVLDGDGDSHWKIH